MQSAADHHEREAAQRPYTLGATVPEAGTYMTTPTVRGDATTGTYDTDAGTRTDVTTGAEVNTPIGLPGEGPRHNVTAGTFDTRKGGPGGGDINAGDYDVDTGKHRDKVPIKPR